MFVQYPRQLGSLERTVEDAFSKPVLPSSFTGGQFLKMAAFAFVGIYLLKSLNQAFRR